MTALTRADQRPDVHEMVVVHRAFRREFGAAADHVRRTPAGDTRRAKIVASHLRLCTAGLEMHHTGEDIVLWPLLLERSAPSTGLVETMQAQHHSIDGHVEAITPALATWEAAPTEAAGEHLAILCERFTAALLEHLDLEEREVLPLASRHVTAAEWNQMGQHGKDAMTPSQLPIMFGLVLQDADDEERARMLGNLPLPIRFLLKTVGAWQFRRYVRRLRAS
ncbi:hemerythrin domain-containing protein [Dactylosporangium sp. AC04546]|uniref:hemerythrin domain-containing protein n=1 Tax=Dactylosporangium sp. AC04546 TaxID=2862460 RepID=UPI001EDF02DD|nr:hemerythrin domain-containing protein [Dactylosporangium sp. AC04546]WVK84227.1 hemerythrin domain-containing protein [Dactylosporangium sp. AC04546]